MINFAILTISDTRTLANDKSGDYLASAIKNAKHNLAAREICRDDIAEIRRLVTSQINSSTDVVITTGGTGFTGRDLTIEAIAPLFEKTIDGFSVAFHQLSFGKIGSSTMQSRACAGLVGDSFVFCLPGSPSACIDAWENLLLPQFDENHKPCNFVEIMPRLHEK